MKLDKKILREKLTEDEQDLFEIFMMLHKETLDEIYRGIFPFVSSKWAYTNYIIDSFREIKNKMEDGTIFED